MKIQHLTILGALGLALAGCSGGSGSSVLTPQKPGTTPGTPTFPTGNFVQIERLSRPAVKELFEKFNDHQISNAAEPYQDPTLQSSISSFSSAFRDTATAGALTSILYPDEYAVDLSQSTTTAAYLGVETKGATGSSFGGRAINDDVISADIGAVFGHTLSKLGVVPDDNKENNCLSAENITIAATQKSTNTFPFFAPPH